MAPVILVKYASRSRPKRFVEGMESIWSLAADPSAIWVYVILDDDDPTLGAYLSYLDLNEHRPIAVSVGYSTSKIHAINRPIAVPLQWDILVNFSDDMRFTVFGWDTLIRDAIAASGQDSFVHFPDSTARAALPTMSVMDRTYYDRDGYVYHPSFKSLWADNFAMDVAKLRGRYSYIGTQIFDHYHPAYGMAEWDDQYRRQQALWDEDENTYLYLKANNYFLDGYGNMGTDQRLPPML